MQFRALAVVLPARSGRKNRATSPVHASAFRKVGFPLTQWPGLAVPDAGCDLRYNASMDTYTLASKARPRLQDGQETRLYDAIEELGGGPLTLDQIVKQCKYRRYESLLKTETIENSVAWHLRNWIKRNIITKG